MYGDLAQMSKAGGIYRTLALLAILSHRPVGNKKSNHLHKNESLMADKKANVGNVGVEDERIALPR